MLDQSYNNLNCCFFGCVFIADPYLFQEIVLSSPYFMFFENMLLFIDKVTTETKSLVPFIWKVTLVVSGCRICSVGGIEVGLVATPEGFDISEIIYLFDHDKSSPISQLSKCKPRNLQKLLKYFNVTTSSVPNLVLLADVFLIIFVLYLKDLHVVLLLFVV